MPMKTLADARQFFRALIECGSVQTALKEFRNQVGQIRRTDVLIVGHQTSHEGTMAQYLCSSGESLPWVRAEKDDGSLSDFNFQQLRGKERVFIHASALQKPELQTQLNGLGVEIVTLNEIKVEKIRLLPAITYLLSLWHGNYIVENTDDHIQVQLIDLCHASKIEWGGELDGFASGLKSIGWNNGAIYQPGHSVIVTHGKTVNEERNQLLINATMCRPFKLTTNAGQSIEIRGILLPEMTGEQFSSIKTQVAIQAMKNGWKSPDDTEEKDAEQVEVATIVYAVHPDRNGVPQVSFNAPEGLLPLEVKSKLGESLCRFFGETDNESLLHIFTASEYANLVKKRFSGQVRGGGSPTAGGIQFVNNADEIDSSIQDYFPEEVVTRFGAQYERQMGAREGTESLLQASSTLFRDSTDSASASASDRGEDANFDNFKALKIETPSY